MGKGGGEGRWPGQLSLSDPYHHSDYTTPAGTYIDFAFSAICLAALAAYDVAYRILPFVTARGGSGKANYSIKWIVFVHFSMLSMVPYSQRCLAPFVQ